MGNAQSLNLLNLQALSSKEKQEWRRDSNIPFAFEMVPVINDKAGRRVQVQNTIGHHWETNMFRKCRDLVLQELGTEQVLLILLDSVAVPMYGLKDRRALFMFLQLFEDSQSPV